MKILIDLTSLSDNFSGIERYAAEISRELMKYSEHEFIFVYKEKPFFSEEELTPNVKTVILKRCNKLLFYQFRLKSFLRKAKADAYFFPAFPAPLFLRKKSMFATVHDLCCWDYPQTMNAKSRLYFRAGLKREIKKCKKIFTVSEFSKSRIIEKFNIPAERVVIAYNGISDRFMRVDPDVTGDAVINSKYKLPDKYILSLSTIEPRKNIRLLLEAYQAVLKQGTDICDLVLAGRDGWKNSSLMDGIDEDVKKRIHFTGFIDEEDLPYIYGRAEFFVFPSIYEGFGLPPLEAMACGTLVLSSDASSLPEVLGESATYFRSEDLEDLIKRLPEMLSYSEDERDKRKRTGKDRAKQFVWKESAAKILDAFISD